MKLSCPYSLRLRSEQVTFLRSLPNASRWVRDLIDQGRVKDLATSAGSRTILIAQQIRDIEGQIAALEANPILSHAREELEKWRTLGEEREGRLELLQAFMVHPENWRVTEWSKLAGRMDEPVRTESTYLIRIPAADSLAPDEVKAASRDELTRKVLEKAGYNQAILVAERETIKGFTVDQLLPRAKEVVKKPNLSKGRLREWLKI